MGGGVVHPARVARARRRELAAEPDNRLRYRSGRAGLMIGSLLGGVIGNSRNGRQPGHRVLTATHRCTFGRVCLWSTRLWGAEGGEVQRDGKRHVGVWGSGRAAGWVMAACDATKNGTGTRCAVLVVLWWVPLCARSTARFWWREIAPARVRCRNRAFGEDLVDSVWGCGVCTDCVVWAVWSRFGRRDTGNRVGGDDYRGGST